MRRHPSTSAVVSVALLFSITVSCSPSSVPVATQTPTAMSTATPVPPTATSRPPPSPTPDPHAGWTYFTNNPDYVHPDKDSLGLIPNAQYGMMEAIACSMDGSIWVNNRLRGGVSRFDGEQWITYSPTPDLPLEWVFDIDVAPDGSVWFAGPKDILIGYSDGQWETSSFAGTGYAGYVHSMEIAPDGTIWLQAGDRGVIYRRGSAWKRLSLDSLLPFTEDDNVVRTISAGPDGSVWFGTDAGIARYQNGKLTFTPVPDAYIVSLLATQNGDVWYGTMDAYTGPPEGRKDFYNLARLNDPSGEKLLTGHLVHAIAEGPGGILWVGTDDGLYRYDGNALDRWDVENGLPYPSVMDVYPAPDGSVWTVSNEFVAHFQPGIP